ncbi:MAG: hypothetical protein KF745_12005 [Phycisphaeraceae bacterium]|nr:hypothetical protein [Phycisphaeraceae bacterium]
MHSGRTAVVSLMLTTSVVWGVFVFVGAPGAWPALPPSMLFHRVVSVMFVLLLGAVLWYDMVLTGEGPGGTGGI